MVSPLEVLFPGLADGDYQITSPKDEIYNCIAWAAGDTSIWWWPNSSPHKRGYWPPGVSREVTLDAFQAALAFLGYMPCAGEEAEQGFEKVALFADCQGKPTHA